MASLNRVDLIGVVASRLQRVATPDATGFVVLTERADGAGVERHRVVVDARTRLESLSVGDTAYLRGRLERVRGRGVVVLREGFCVLPAPQPEHAESPLATSHRSPVPHERRGHLRHVGVGTPRERVVWVRATTVQGRSAE